MTRSPYHSTRPGRRVTTGAGRSVIGSGDPELMLAAEPADRPSKTGPILDDDRSSAGDEGARHEFASFYRAEHEGQVRRAFLLLGSESAAHDVVADAFVTVYRRWNVIDTPGPYLNRCVLNGCRDAYRTTNREVPTDLGDSDLPNQPASASESSDPVDHIADLLAALPFRQRAAIVLRFYGRQSEAEIADYLDCRPGTVGSLVHRALKTLKKDLT